MKKKWVLLEQIKPSTAFKDGLTSFACILFSVTEALKRNVLAVAANSAHLICLLSMMHKIPLQEEMRWYMSGVRLL